MDGRTDGQTEQGKNNIPDFSLESAGIKKINKFLIRFPYSIKVGVYICIACSFSQ